MKSIGNSRGTLPSIRSIHENSYAWHHTSLDDLNKLLNVTPCTLGGVYRWMPLMYAARNGANESVIRRLIQEQPQAVRLMDCDGWLPIHYSSYTGNQEACKVLLEAYPNSIYVTTKRSTNSSDAYNSDEQKAPLKLAKEQGMWTTVNYLKQFIETYEKITVQKIHKYKRWNGYKIHPDVPWYAPPNISTNIIYTKPPTKTNKQKCYLREIYYCTNRSPSSKEEDVEHLYYSNKRIVSKSSVNGFLNFGKIQIIFPGRKHTDIITNWQENRILEITELNVDIRATPAKLYFGEYINFKMNGMPDIKTSLRHYTSILLYVPGTNSSFWDGVLAASTFADDIEFKGTVCTYSWPSYNDKTKYNADVCAAHSSSMQLASYISNLMTTIEMAKQAYMPMLNGDCKIQLCCHSLGASCLLDALLIVAMGDTQRAKLYLGNLVFLLPDIDLEHYNQKMNLIRNIVGRVAIYSQRDDEFMKVSVETHQHVRLGTCPTGSVNVLHGDVYYCGKYYDNYIPGTSSGKFSKLCNDRIWNEIKMLLSG